MKYFLGLTIILILIPYIGISILPSDLQPFALLFSLICLGAMHFSTGKTIFPKFLFPILFMAIFAILAFFISIVMVNDGIGSIDAIRALYGYLTPLIISLFA